MPRVPGVPGLKVSWLWLRGRAHEVSFAGVRRPHQRDGGSSGRETHERDRGTGCLRAHQRRLRHEPHALTGYYHRQVICHLTSGWVVLPAGYGIDRSARPIALNPLTPR